MEDQESRLIYSFPRGSGEEVQIALRKYQGRHYADIRVWFLGKEDKEFHPTRKGVFFPIRQTSELKKGIERLAIAAEQIPPDMGP